jgi:hypothetical protein
MISKDGRVHLAGGNRISHGMGCLYYAFHEIERANLYSIIEASHSRFDFRLPGAEEKINFWV